MIRILFVALLIASVGARATDWVDDERIAQIFAEADLNGVFVLLDREADRFVTNDRARAQRPFLPASTFKIPNSLIALEEGVIADENERFAWDGVDRGFSSWNRDHTLASAFRVSAVWCYTSVP